MAGLRPGRSESRFGLSLKGRGRAATIASQSPPYCLVYRLSERYTRTTHLFFQEPLNIRIQGNRGPHIGIMMHLNWMRQDAQSPLTVQG